MSLSAPLLIASGFNYFETFLKLPSRMVPVVVTALVAGGLYLLANAVMKAYDEVDDPVIPDPKVSLRGIIEMSIQGLLSLFEGMLGERAKTFLPLLGTVFIYIFVSNMLGVIPGMPPPTGNINTNYAVALVVFIFYNYQGYKEHGKGYLKHFMGPIVWLAPLIVVIEVLSHFVRVLSLSVRLFGNINGDHMVLGIFSNLLPPVIPVIFLCLGIFVAFIQAFVFTLLSTIYVSMAVSHDH